MSATAASAKRPQTAGEEIANTVSHAVALVAALIALPVLIVDAVRDSAGAAIIVGASIFGTAMLLLYLTSALYHALPVGQGKRVFKILDHCAIYLMIAGTYTPFALGALRGPWGWTLLGVIWALAVIGIIYKTCFRAHGSTVSTLLYIAMGWLVLIAIKPLIDAVPTTGLLWLLAGGIAYTLGVVFYALDHRVRYAHFVWHLFVLTGSACHFVAVLCYAG